MELPAFPGDAVARPLLHFLLVHHPAHFHISELVREFANPQDDPQHQELVVSEALARLDGHALVHRTSSGFVFASRTALRAKEAIAEP